MTTEFKLNVVRGQVLGIEVLRGFAQLSDLARLSQADVYDQASNPTGTQRDLNRRHAREAYEYVKSRARAFFPEIVLNARDDAVWTYEPFRKSAPEVGVLTLDLAKIRRSGRVVISRVDGNHRLYFADGHDPKYPPLDVSVSFCLIVGLAGPSQREAELAVFRDINANQKGMNTSHLDSIAVRLAEKNLVQRDPVLYIAERLMEDADSPFKGRVYRGGVKPSDTMIPLRNVKTSVQYMQQRSKELKRFGADPQARLIKNYWKAAKRWIPEAWEDPRKNIALRSTGFWAMAFIGADVVDRAVTSGNIEVNDMLKILRSGQAWDWSTAGDFRGYGGRAGAAEIANMVTREFASDGPSIADIERKLLG